MASAMRDFVSKVGWKSRRRFAGKAFGIQGFVRTKAAAKKMADGLRKGKHLVRVTPVRKSRIVGTYLHPQDGYIVWANIKRGL